MRYYIQQGSLIAGFILLQFMNTSYFDALLPFTQLLIVVIMAACCCVGLVLFFTKLYRHLSPQRDAIK